MTAFILACAVLSGPPMPSDATLQLRIHLGRDRNSAIARQELACQHEWFWERRLKIEAHYRILTDDEALDWPTWSIGRGQERHRFLPGSFAGSGCFMTALFSIAQMDQWERQEPTMRWTTKSDGTYGHVRDTSDRPVPFPPQELPEIPIPDEPLEGIFP